MTTPFRLSILGHASGGAPRSVVAAPPPAIPAPPTPETLARLRKFVDVYARKSGTTTHADPAVTEAVLLGLGNHVETIHRPLCPCRHYDDKAVEAEHRTWVCACDDMQVYKYCHCLLFTNEEGLPITEHLPEDHPGRRRTD